jgi:hypothetical protein
MVYGEGGDTQVRDRFAQADVKRPDVVINPGDNAALLKTRNDAARRDSEIYYGFPPGADPNLLNAATAVLNRTDGPNLKFAPPGANADEAEKIRNENARNVRKWLGLPDNAKQNDVNEAIMRKLDAEELAERAKITIGPVESPLRLKQPQ